MSVQGPRRRNYSPQEYFLGLAREHRPRYGFDGEFESWQAAALPEVLALLGRIPPAVDPRPELIAEWQQEGLTWQRWTIDVCDGLSAVAYVNRRSDLPADRSWPGIMCWHGHTPAGQGKEAVMGNKSSPALSQSIRSRGSNYGQQMAEAGFVTFAIDWMGRGDLDDNRKYRGNAAGRDWRGRDWCNLYYLLATMLGMTPLGLNAAFGRALVDFVTTLPFIDPDRLGVMGESTGGTMTLWSALTDERLKAAEIICYSDLFADFYRNVQCCGSQIVPGLYQLVDLPDLQGLLAPRPLLVDIGTFDQVFQIEPALRCHENVREIYTAAGAADSLELDLAPRGHGWCGNKSIDFFGTRLGGRYVEPPAAE